MNLIISFSGREGGNCDNISEYIATEGDTIIHFRNLHVHDCSGCRYECFEDVCKYRGDDIYNLFESMVNYEKIFFIVPMYCGNPTSLYFKLNERSQDFFMHNEEIYEAIVSKLYIIGIYGEKNKTPDFIPCFETWFEGTELNHRVLGIERHKYGQKMEDKILGVKEIKQQIDQFIWQ
ncbi:MAG: flavodoxin family protein [Agathobacter sp.]|nr:flavodoxin family protein [Agathobacter sp.]